MALYQDNDIPSIVVRAGTPPPLQPRPPAKRESLEGIYYGRTLVKSILQDGSEDLKQKVQKKEDLNTALTRTISQNYIVAEDEDFREEIENYQDTSLAGIGWQPFFRVVDDIAWKNSKQRLTK